MDSREGKGAPYKMTLGVREGPIVTEPRQRSDQESGALGRRLWPSTQGREAGGLLVAGTQAQLVERH